MALDSLLSADSYKFYGEVRMIGQQVHSGGIIEFLEPFRQLGTTPPEMKAAVDFLTSNGDLLASSRLVFAAAPAKPKLPQVFVAVELLSAEDAQKFEPKLRAFLGAMSTAKATPSAENRAVPQDVKSGKPTAPKPASPPYFVKRAGNLILVADSAFTLKNLHPEGSRLLSEDVSFREVRDRLATESFFFYYNVALPYAGYQARLATGSPVEERANVHSAQAKAKNAERGAGPGAAPSPTSSTVVQQDTHNPAVLVGEARTPNNEPEEVTAVPQSGIQGAPVKDGGHPIALPFLGMILGGESGWPGAIGASSSLEGDAFVNRLMLVNVPGAPPRAIPFVPMFVSGPPLSPRSTAIVPGDAGIFIDASLDLPQMYDALITAMPAPGTTIDVPGKNSRPPAVESEMAAFEKKLGLRIKDDLLPALGNELAVSLPVQWLTGATPTKTQAAQPQPGIAFFVSLKDKEKARELLPRVIEAAGLKALGDLAQTEKKDDIEIINYGVGSVAFIEDFLVVAQDALTLRHVVDSYINHQTLSSNSGFKNSTSWQPREVLGQVYISQALMGSLQSSMAKGPLLQADQEGLDYLSRFKAEPEAITYALTAEGPGLMHELHIPRSLVNMLLAQMAVGTKPSATNERMASGFLQMVASAQKQYKEKKGSGGYASLDELKKNGLFDVSALEKYGYKLDLKNYGNKFEVTATPMEYGKSGRLSFFIDESGVLRGGDKAGQPATAADKPLEGGVSEHP